MQEDKAYLRHPLHRSAVPLPAARAKATASALKCRAAAFRRGRLKDQSPRRVFVVDALRTPIALRRGGLARVRPEHFGAAVVRELLRRTGVAGGDLDAVFAGNAVGTGGNIARLMSFYAGVPQSVPAVTIDMQCASAAASISLAFAKIAAGQADAIVAGGMESVSLQPARIYAEGDERRGQLAATGGSYYTAQFSPDDLHEDAMLRGSERVMEQEGVTRAELDRWVLESHQRAAQAERDGVFRPWMLPLEGSPFNDTDDELARALRLADCTRDEGIKPRMRQRLLDRMPLLYGDGTLLTAANACRTNDGAAFLLLASEAFVKAHGLAPQMEVLATAATGVAPGESPRGAQATAEKLLAREQLSWTDLAAIEFNEAFAVIDVLLERTHPEVMNCYNQHGGALAYGHPYGASGAILAIQLLAALQTAGGLGLLSIAGAGGLGEAVLFEKRDSYELL